MSVDSREFERAIQETEHRKKIAQARAADIRRATDIEGKVKVYRTDTGNAVRLWPVDAAEQIKMGLATLRLEPAAVPTPTDADADARAPVEPPEPVSPGGGEFDE